MIRERTQIGDRLIQALFVALYSFSLTVAGFAAIHFVSANPVVIGPFALMIGMTPFVDIFTYSLPVPMHFFPLGLVVSLVTRFLCRTSGSGAWRWPTTSGIYLALTGSLLFALFIVILVGASAYYNVGFMDRAETPLGWEICRRLGARVGETGIVLALVGVSATPLSTWSRILGLLNGAS
jgi:hypothetical protein